MNPPTTRVAVLVSGGGTNLQTLMDRIREGRLPGVRIACVLASRDGTLAEERARKAGIPVAVTHRRDLPDDDAHDRALLSGIDRLAGGKVDLVVLAGYLTRLGPRFLSAYPGRILNVHPALIPAFCGPGQYGIRPHEAVLDAGVRITGATVHFVDGEYDTGPIILQKAVEVRQDDTPRTLQLRVMQEAEQVLLPEAVRLFAEGRLRIEGRRVRILPEPEQWTGQGTEDRKES